MSREDELRAALSMLISWPDLIEEVVDAVKSNGLLAPEPGPWEYAVPSEYTENAVHPCRSLEHAWRWATARGDEPPRQVLQRRRDVLVRGTDWEPGPEPWSFEIKEKS